MSATKQPTGAENQGGAAGPAVLPHHEAAAALWGQGGAFYDHVSYAISDALAHAAQRLNAKPGQRILDVATGTGWTARNAARAGAQVTGVDIADALLEAAQALSAHVDPPITYRLGDAEALPFDDGAFDGVISTFGVMFAANQEKAASELARVCKPGGRLVVAAWTPDGSVAEFFGVIAKHGDAPPPAASPMNWGDPEQARTLLGDAFDLAFEPGTNTAYHESADEIWDWYASGFGPIRALMDSLGEAGRAALKADMDAYHSHYSSGLGLRVTRDYLLIRGMRR
ncbi:MAG TPA: methyltransferase domain-containing protein [Alphaproteobacteria bacterium]|nr:methyltransferase domain-containing protein [Alphaproteobacteria bacterium]